MAQPPKPATPLDAASGLVVQVSLAPEVPMPAVMVRVTLLESPDTTLPPASSMATDGCVDSALPPVPSPGCWVKTSCDAAPVSTLKAVLTPGVSELSVAVSV